MGPRGARMLGYASVMRNSRRPQESQRNACSSGAWERCVKDDIRAFEDVVASQVDYCTVATLLVT
jgi:hypothetical protein